MNAPDTYKVVTWHEYGIARIRERAWYFRWYWQANAWSFLMHHLMGCSCNTFRKGHA